MSNPHYPEPERVAVNDEIADAFVEAANRGACSNQDGNVESGAGWWATFGVADLDDLHETLDVDAFTQVIQDSKIVLPAALMLRIDSDGNRELFSFKVDSVHLGSVRSYSMEGYEQDLVDEYLKWTVRGEETMLLCSQLVNDDPLSSETCMKSFTDISSLFEHLIENHFNQYIGTWQIQIGPSSEVKES